ncbi:hypothetical protein BJ085DRAFT_36903 [Dimargaris cristalligena]|uniref:Carrier domain-containing protein n=1 Tax=Dimargaris cristalligena TaxID=215637 RepID=A0A4Q0A0Z3_9FUNG|nr:hypothetical protein BJ085DRAFT_36903 [Dimargaris cristalligena]|eukprot:RKP39725.1 hypothetical protein BJ085DRAFT_36903 [Dimargaris cristalligena]
MVAFASAPISHSMGFLLPVVPMEYQPDIDLPLGKPRTNPPGYAAWCYGVSFPDLDLLHHDQFKQGCQLAMATLLSRYYRQPAVAFAHWQGPVGPNIFVDQFNGELDLVLARMNPDTPVSAISLQHLAPDYLPTLSGPVVEVVLHSDADGSSTLTPMSETNIGYNQPKEVEANSHITELLAQSTAHLVVSCALGQGHFQITVTYARALYRDSAVAEFTSQFGTVLQAVAQALLDDQPTLVREIPWVSDRELARLSDFSHSGQPTRAIGRPVHHLFGDCAQLYPDHLALVDGSNEWTYAQLDYASSELARVLVAQYSACPEVRFALLIPKSIAYMVTILAVLKSGAAYVPLDPDYPTDRIQFVLEDSDASLLLVDESSFGRVASQFNVPTMTVNPFVQQPISGVLSDFQPFLSAPSDLAYVIYTSGTTGRPKGVLIEHRGVANFATDPYLRREYGPGRRVYQAGSVAFDGILVNTFRALCAGGTLVIPTDNILEDLQNIHVGTLTTTFLSRLDPKGFTNLETLAIGGESLLPDQQARWTPHCILANHYGPTETTVYSNLAAIGRDDDITIGRPIGNVINLVVDDELQLVPVGVPGELLIGGIGVARGYQNLPELTAQKFIPNPYGEGRVYRTGDYVRWLSNGTVEFLGRIDNQIKLRGYRIEIEEIENVASQFPGLKQCVAAVVEDTLVLYASPEDLEPTSLLDYLKDRLSKQMVPELVVPVPNFKTTILGKLDRRSLPSIGHLLSKNSFLSPTGSDTNGPQSEAEEDLRRVWGKVLQRDPGRIGTTDHFFKVGGDSISAILLVSECRQLGYQLTVSLIYQYPELFQMAAQVQHLSSIDNINGVQFSLSEIEFQQVTEELGHRGISSSEVEVLLPCIGVQGGLLVGLGVDPSAYTVQISLKLNGSLDYHRLTQAWNAVASQHPPLRTVFVESSAKRSQGFVQAVIRSPSDVWTLGNKPLACLDSFFTNNLRRGFVLQELMIRNFVFPTADSQVHDVVISAHHSHLDGWSMSLLLQAWMAAYHHPEILAPSPLISFPTVVEYLSQMDNTQAGEFWSTYLRNAHSTPAPMLFPGSSGASGSATYYTVIDIPKTQMQQFTQSVGITLATLFRAAYALVLSRLLDQDDVIFGVILSGRNLDLLGMDQVIGLCINTLPFRACLGQSPLYSWLQSLHQAQSNMIQFEHSTLPDVTRWASTGQSGPLFHTLLGFENYNGYAAEPSHHITLSDLRVHEATEYPLTVDFLVQSTDIQAKALYSTSTYSEEAIRHLVGMIQTAVEQIILAQPGTTVDQLTLMTSPSSHSIVYDQEEFSAASALPAQSLAKTWDTIILEYSEHPVYISKGHVLLYGQLDHLADGLALQSGQILKVPRPSIMALVESVEQYMVCLVSAVKMGARLTLLAPPCTIDQLVVCVNLTASQIAWLPSAKAEEIRPFLKGVVPLITVPSAIDESISRTLAPRGFKPLIDRQDPSLTFTSKKNSDDLVLSTINGSCIRCTLASTHHYTSDKAGIIIDHSLSLDTPQAAWLILSSLTSHATVLSHTSPLDEHTKSSSCHVMTADALHSDLGESNRLVLCDLAQAHQSDCISLVKSTDICISFIESIFHGYQQVTKEQLTSQSFPTADKPSNNYCLDVLDGHGHPCPPGAVGRLTFTSPVPLDHSAPQKYLILGYRADDNRIHMLGPDSQRVVVKGQHIHLGILTRALTEAGALSPQCIVLPDGRPVALIANTAEVDLTRLKEFATPPAIPLALVPHAIISIYAFPHVAGLSDHHLAFFVQAYLTTLTLRHSESLLETEWWLTVVVNELCASPSHSNDYTTTSLLRTSSEATLVQLEMFQYRIRIKFGINMPLGDLVKHAELRTLASTLLDRINRLPSAYSGDSGVEEVSISVPVSSQLNLRSQAVTDRQHQIWSLSRLGHTPSDFYHQCVITSEVPLQLEVVQRAVNNLSATFESLRCQFISVRGALTCTVLPQVRTGISETQLSTSQSLSMDKLFSDEVKFNLDRGVLSQVNLYHFPTTTEGGAASAICLRIHDIAADWQMFSKMVNHLTMGLYGISPNNSEPLVTKLNPGYHAVKGTDTSYWTTLLSDPPTELTLPLDHARPLLPSFRSATVHLTIEPKLVSSLASLKSAGPFAQGDIWLALFAVFLRRLTGQDDIVIDYCGLEDPPNGQVGGSTEQPATNLPVRCSGNWPAHIPQLAENINLQRHQSMSHPIPSIDFYSSFVDHLGLNRLSSSLARVRISLHQGSHEKSGTNGSQITYPDNSQSLFPYDLELVIRESTLGHSCHLLFNPDILESSTAKRLLSNFLHYAQECLCSEMSWSDASTVSTKESRVLLQEFALGGLHPDQMAVESPAGVLCQFNRMAALYPNCSATEISGQVWTYLDLVDRIHLVAAGLRDAQIQPGDKIGVIVTNHPNTVAGMLAAWVVGAVYVPVDHKLPVKRQKYVIEAACCKVVLNATDSPSQLPNTLVLSELLEGNGDFGNRSNIYNSRPDDLAYVIFTSGSTGLPKGVMVTHSNLDHQVGNPVFQDFQVAGQRVMAGTAPGFDVFILNSLLPLCNGSTLVFYGDNLAETLRQVDQTWLVPSVINRLNPSDYPNLKKLCLAGEPLSRELVDKWSIIPDIYNGYGPTETTIISHFTRVPPTGTIPIGPPIFNYECYILDSQLQLVPIGAIGEILIGGVGVSCGYINRSDLNPTAFIENTFTGRGKLYRTGDLGRWLTNGQVECLGRMDSQIKLRGFRIELDEIRSVLMRQLGVQNCVVFVHGQFLVGYVFPESAANSNGLHIALADSLPSYMVPSYFMGLPTVPLTANGKCDTKFLQSHFTEYLASQRKQAPSSNLALDLSSRPLGALTEALADQWFFDHPWRNPHHFNQSFALELTQTLSAPQIESALLRLINHHDILRCQFTQDVSHSPNRWSQCILPPFASLPIPVVEVTAPLSDCPGHFLSIQSSLDISQGHHMAAGLITLSEHNIDSSSDTVSHFAVSSQASPRQLLYLTIHHLVVDLVSWSILLEDLARLLDGQLPVPQHLSFVTWATELVDWAKETAHVADLSLAPMILASFLPLSSPDALAFNTQRNSQYLSITLDKINSDALLGAYDLPIQPLELMFAGIFQALYSLTQASALCVFNESHGRHSWESSLDPSHTVGWFTALVPCQVQADAGTSTSDFLKLAKQALRSSNGTNGLQYGLQRIVNCSKVEASNDRPYLPIEVVFNYLGHTMDYGTLTQQGRAPWAPRPELTAGLAVCDADELRTQILEIIGYPTSEGLVFMVRYCPQVIATGIIESLLGCFRDSLVGMVQAIQQSPSPPLWTPTDFPDLQATLPELTKLESELATIGLTPHDVEDLYPMLPMQQGMWTATAKDPSEYLVQLAFTVTGVSNVDRLEAATQAVVSDYTVLRTMFVTTWSNFHCQGVQVVTREPRFGWQIINEWSDVDSICEADFMQSNKRRGFGPNEPLLRVLVNQLSANVIRYLLSIHHALIDGWSIGILISRLRAHLQNNAGIQLVRPPVFRDYVAHLQKSSKEDAKLFWSEYLRGIEQPTDLELPKPARKCNSPIAELKMTLFQNVSPITQLAHRMGITPYVLVKSAWALLLSRYTGQPDVIFGNTVSGRALPLADIESHLGCLINTVPFRVHADESMSVAQWVTAIHDNSQQVISFEHHHISEINTWVEGEIRPSDLFNTLVVYESYPETEINDRDHSVIFTDTEFLESSDYPLTLVVLMEKGQLNACLKWNSQQFGSTYIDVMARHLFTLFNGLVSALSDTDGQVRVQDLPMLSPNERAVVIEKFASRHLTIDPGACVPDLFTRSAQIRPNVIAVEYEDTKWTYAYLHSQALNLAQRLLVRGVPRETPIGLLIDRIPSTIAAFMGLQLSGAVLVPLDPTFPIERIRYIVEDCNIGLVLTNMADQSKLDTIHLALTQVEIQPIDPLLLPLQLAQDQLPILPHIHSSDLSYIVYTSGTTGRPKGVQIEHCLMGNFVQQLESTVGISAGLRLMQNMAMTFDGALLEIFTSLCKGATLVLRTDLLDTLPKVNGLFATPTVLASLDPTKYPNLQMVISGGEALPQEVAKRWAHHCRVFNMYGPTEVLASHTVEYRLGDVMTIGYPVPNTQGYILDRFLHPVPIGVRGEIYVGGAQVTRGYVNLPGLNAARLIPNPFSGSGNMYRTGDSARWLPNGTVEYFSRHDDQVKIRGHRIEPREIEAVLLSHPDVQSAAVVIISQSIYGFVCPASVSIGSIKLHIGRILPAYMNPKTIFIIEMLPCNTNGKTDKHALATRIAELTVMTTGRAITAPLNSVQALVVEALSQTLDIPSVEIDIYDSFFQHGGDSISAIRLSSLCRDRGLYLSIAQVFKCSNIIELAECASDHAMSDNLPEAHNFAHYEPYSLLGEVGDPSSVVKYLLHEASSQLKMDLDNITDILPASGLQLGFLISTLKDPSAYMVQESFTISGDLDLDRLQQAWYLLAEHHDILRTKFFRPESLSSHSFLQVITKRCDIEWSVHTDIVDDWSTLEKTYFEIDRRRGFTFDGPLLRMGFFTSPATGDLRHLCFLTFHHALLDAWSQNIVLTQLVDLYHGTKPTPSTQFSSYISHLQSTNPSQLQKFWQTTLENAQSTPPIHFPVHLPEPLDCNYGIYRTTLSLNLSSLHAFCRQQSITLNSLLRSVWALTLSRYLGLSSEVSFGVLTSGRNVPVPGVQEMVGMCINTIPFRASLDQSTSVTNFVQRLHRQSGELTASEQCGLVDIYKWGQINSETKLFNSLMIYDNFPPSAPSTSNPDITLELSDVQNFTEYAYTVSFFDNSDNLDCHLVYDMTHCDDTYACHLIRFIDHCLSMMVHAPCLSLGELMILPIDEAQLVHGWAQGPVREFPQKQWLAYRLFSQHVSSRSEAVALETSNHRFTYAEVYHRSCCIALTLQQRGFSPGNLAALIFTKSADFIFSYLGVLLAGGVCIPMDAGNALDRLQYMFGLLDSPWLMTTVSHYKNCSDHISVMDSQCCFVDTMDYSKIVVDLFRPDTSRTSSDLAYIVFTSGTTGRPKGIPVRHESLVNFTVSNCETIQLDTECRFLQLLNISFDGCLLEIFGAFHCGGTLVLQDGNLLDTLTRVDTCFLIPSMLSAIDIETYPNLKTVFIGGEPVPLNIAYQWCERVRLFNIYGPTEITIVCHTDQVYSSEPLSIGRSLANTQGGKIQFISRKDFQVKLRGYRIELGEIENVASSVDGVTNAIACVSQQQLILYIAPGSVDTGALRTQLTVKLPQYMVPNFIIPLDSIPMTTVGKADRKTLQARALPEDTTDEAIDIDSLSSIFQLMRAALVDTLKIDPQRATPSASFLRLGGDSISAIQFSNRCKRLGLRLSVADILKYPQLSVMEQRAHMVDTNNLPSAQFIDPAGPIPFTAVQRYALKQYRFINQFNQSMLLKCRQTLTRTTLAQTLTTLMAHHDILRVQLEHSNGQWQQRVISIPAGSSTWSNRFLSIEEATLTLDEYPAWVSQIQRNISIEHGPIMACGLLMLDGEQHIYLTIHHFAVDFVSWRIILEDLEALLTNQDLPAKTMPFRDWATQVHTFAQTLSESIWPVEFTPADSIPLDYPFSSASDLGTPLAITYHSFEVQQASLGLDLSDTLYTEVSPTVGASPQEFLIASLLLSLQKTFGLSVIELELEGHGRRTWDSAIDISRTVGWFTSIYPALFHLNQAETHHAFGHTLGSLALVKQRMRSIPDHGFPYSLQRYLKGTSPLSAPAINRAAPEAGMVPSDDWNRITFNYSGRFEQLEAQNAFWRPHHIEMGWTDDWSKDEVFSRALSVACDYTVGEGLVLSVMYSNKLHHNITIQRLVDQWRTSLEELILECKVVPAPSIVTASDFSSAQLTESDFAKMVQDDLPLLDLILADIEDIYPCLPVQEGLLFATLQDPAAYMVQLGFNISGQLNVGRFYQAWNQTARDHPILRTRFLTASGCDASKNLQVVARDFNAHWLIRSWEKDCADTMRDQFFLQERTTGFNPDQPWIRFGLFRTAPNSFKLLVSVHHALIDGWSVGLLLHSVCCNYFEDPLPKAVHYRDFVDYIGNQDNAVAKRFWSDKFSGVGEPSLLVQANHHPAFPALRPSDTAFYGTVERSVPILEKINKLISTNGVTLSTLLRVAMAATLHRHTGSTDPVFGVVVSGRNVPVEGVENIIGACINTIPCRVALGNNPSVRDILQAVYATSTQTHGFEHCRLTDIHRWSGLSQDRPLFNTLLVLENYPETSANPNLPFQLELDSYWDPTDFPLAVIVHTQGDQLQFRVTYRTLDFSPEFIHLFADHFITTLSCLLSADASSPLSDIQILSPLEREQLLVSWATNPQDFPPVLAHDLFSQQCQSEPHAVALIHNGQKYTYTQLDMAANRLAHSLVLLIPCGSDRIVALVADNCPELIIGQLAIWKTGCAFVILAPDYPLERHQLILKDTQAIAIMGKPSCLSAIDDLGLNVPMIPINSDSLFTDGTTNVYLSPAIDPSHLAAIIYTSGSTGIPKGVMHEHHALANHWQGMGSITNMTLGAITPTLVTPTFDVSLSEIWSTLSFGGTLLVSQGDYESALSQATRACCTPSLLSSFEPANFPNLRQVTITGEPANQGIVNRWADSVDLINWYGPTEVACGSHWFRLQANKKIIPIGAPLPNATGIILDTYLRPVPVGAVGQLYLGGRGVARGYLNRPELTQEKFILSPFTSERIYQSGDLARWLPNGQIECLGRIDNQVKLRGFRIELGEIESALEHHAAVAQACVVIQDDTHLVGYIVPPSGQSTAILDSLRSRLPYYMVPSVLVELAELPLTRVGKVDRRTLPKHDFAAISNSHKAAQVSPAEAQLIGLVAETLRIDPSVISPAATFFQVGGNSLSAIQLVSRCRRLNLQLALMDINRSNTITYLAELTSATSDSIEVFDRDAPVPADSESRAVRLTPPQVELFDLQLADPHFFPLATMFESSARFSPEQWQAAWTKVVQRHDMLRARFLSIDGKTVTKFADLDDLSSTCFKYHQMTDIRDALAQLNSINHLINFETGPISQIRVFDINGVQYVYIAVHHLVFDYLSVQIVREDLSAFVTDQTVEPLTHSYRAWADHLWSLAQSVDPMSIDLLPSVCILSSELSVDGTPMTNETRERVVVLIDQNATHRLMTTVAQQLGATPIELILTTLVCAYYRQFGLSQMDMAYVGHGRRDPRGQCDVSRTVGFFACQLPLVFQGATNGNLMDTLRAVQSTLSTGVDNGFLYTVVKNLHCFTKDQVELQQQFDVQPQFGFTYLDDMAVRDSSDADIILVERSAMLNDLRTAKSQNKYPYLLDFGVWNTTEGLEIITNFNSRQFRMDTMRAFNSHWKECLLEVSQL